MPESPSPGPNPEKSCENCFYVNKDGTCPFKVISDKPCTDWKPKSGQDTSRIARIGKSNLPAERALGGRRDKKSNPDSSADLQIRGARVFKGLEAIKEKYWSAWCMDVGERGWEEMWKQIAAWHEKMMSKQCNECPINANEMAEARIEIARLKSEVEKWKLLCGQDAEIKGQEIDRLKSELAVTKEVERQLREEIVNINRENAEELTQARKEIENWIKKYQERDGQLKEQMRSEGQARSTMEATKVAFFQIQEELSAVKHERDLAIKELQERNVA